MEPQVTKRSLIEIRDYGELDKNFILATWLRGLYYGESFYSQIPKTIFMENYHAILERFLLGNTSAIKVACLKDDPEVILGYSVVRNIQIGEADIGVLDWIFVKSAWRGIGIAEMLVPKKLNACTHLTKLGSSIIKNKLPNIIFNPFLL